MDERWGVVLRPQLPPSALREVVARTEAAGLDDLWLWEDCFLEAGLTAAAAALAWSDRLRVGVGLLPVPLRNPAVTAMELATLAGLFPGRFAAGLGHGVQAWMAQVGAKVDSPLTLLREHATTIGALLHGARVTLDGRYVHLDDVALDWPPAVPPALLIGGRGPKTLALAAELADGTILDAGAALADVTLAHELAAAASARGDWRDRHEIVAYVELHPGEGHCELVERLRAKRDAGATTLVVQPHESALDTDALLAATVAARSELMDR